MCSFDFNRDQQGNSQQFRPGSNPSRKHLAPGDIFVLQPAGFPYFLGRVIRTDASISGMRGILIYIYNITSPDSEHIPPLRRENLLVPPIITNRLPWSRGYFQTVQRRPLTPWDVLPVHCFLEPLRGRCYDDESRQLVAPIPPVGDHGLHSFRTIDDAVSDALGIPRVPD